MNENNNPYDDWGLPKSEEDKNNNNLSTNDSININNNIFTSHNVTDIRNDNNTSVIGNNINHNNSSDIYIEKTNSIEDINSTIESNNSNNKLEINNNVENKKGLFTLIMSIIIIILAPGLITAWLVFGFVDGLAGYINDNVYLIVPLIYIIFSLVFFLISYIIFFKRSKTKKRKIVLIIVGITILLFISPIIYIIKFIISYN